jgi:hypothetical protein
MKKTTHNCIFLVFVLALALFSKPLIGQEGASGTVTFAKKDTTDKERRGPTNLPFEVGYAIESDFDFAGDKVINIWNSIYRDDNILSGYYYYLPASYTLSWSASEKKYDFQVTYGEAKSDGTSPVTVTATLKPKLSKKDLQIAKEILLQNLKGKPEEKYGIKELIPMPMAEPPKIDFTNLLQFGITEKDMFIRAPSNLIDPVLITFTTTRIKELMAVLMDDIGLYGSVVVSPDGKDMASTIKIPFNLKIDAPQTLGKIEIQGTPWRSEGWRNITDFPLKVTAMHVLTRENAGLYKIFTWKTGDIEVPDGALLKFDASAMPNWIDNNPKTVKIWLDYGIIKCESCKSSVKKQIVKTVLEKETLLQEKININVMSPIAFTKAAFIKVNLRSFQTSQTSNIKSDMESIRIKADNTDIPAGTLFVKSGSSIDFEYQLQVYMSDGKNHDSQWQRSTSNELIISKEQIKTLVPFFKNKS